MSKPRYTRALRHGNPDEIPHQIWLEHPEFIRDVDPGRTGQTLQRMGDVTARLYEFYSTCPGCQFVASHDDLCMSAGPVAAPEWYRRYIFPQYEKIFAPVRAAGQPVIFLSDGNLAALAPDIAPLVDGFSQPHSDSNFDLNPASTIVPNAQHSV